MEPRRSRAVIDEDRQGRGGSAVEETCHVALPDNLGGRTGPDRGFVACDHGVWREQYKQAGEIAAPGGGQESIDHLPIGQLVFGGRLADSAASA